MKGVHAALLLVLPACAAGLRSRALGSSTARSHLRMSAVSQPPALAGVDAAVGDASAFADACGALKRDGAASTYDSLRLAPRLVARQELERLTGIDPTKLLSAPEFDYKGFTAKVIGGSTVLMLAVYSATFLRDDVRFGLSYLAALLPIGLLAVGSTAPNLLAAPGKWLEGRGDEAAQRIAVHEAAHLLTGYSCGLAVESYSLDGGAESGPEVRFAEEAAASRAPLDLDAAAPLLVVAISGLVAEYNKFGSAEGGQADLRAMQQVLSRVTPRLTPPAQQGYTRWAALMAWSHLSTMEPQLDAATAALQRGEPLGTVLAQVEGAAAGPSSSS